MNAIPTSSFRRPSPTSLGVICGIAAGALWGSVFLAPALLHDFSPVQLTIGRYLIYGLIALALLLPSWQSLRRRLPPRTWINLAMLSLLGNTLYYLLVATAVQHGGIAMTSLIVGFLPVLVTIIGTRDRDAVPLRRLAPSLLLCVVGTLCVGWEALSGPREQGGMKQLLALICAVGALVSWTLYAVGNARCLQRMPQISSHEWNLLIGVMTGAQSLVLVPLALWQGMGEHSMEAWVRFGLVSLAVAVLASMAGNALWNGMSRLLPLTTVGQMILFETLFALLYAWLWEQRGPTGLELVALCCVISGVVTCVMAHRPRKPATPAANTNA